MTIQRKIVLGKSSVHLVDENEEGQAAIGGLEVQIQDLVQLVVWRMVPEGVGSCGH